MGHKILLVGLVIVSVCGVSTLPASASTPKPRINKISPSYGIAGSLVTIDGANLANATKVTFDGKVASLTSDKATKILAKAPPGVKTGYITVTTPGGRATSAREFTVEVLTPLNDAISVVGTTNDTGTGSYCALLTSSRVDCWGYGHDGELGNGKLYNTKPYGSATSVAVQGVGGKGTLSGVTSLFSDSSGFCALLTSGGVDCWGDGAYGQLGNGTFYTYPVYSSATPVAVEGVGGSGTLTGVKSLFSDSTGYCALLSSGGVDCWGDGEYGELGNGTFYTSSPYGSATPVDVEGVGGTGTLTGVTSLVGEYLGFCALLTSGGVDCWGNDDNGNLGNGTFTESATPVTVEGVGGTGTLTGVTSLVGDGFQFVGEGYCALLTSGGVDCWGDGYYGELGNGTFYTNDGNGSSTPVNVEGVGGTGTLTGVSKLFSDYGSYCALLSAGGVACWGNGENGELGNGTFYTSSPYGSATPVAVEGIGGTGMLTGVTSLIGNYFNDVEFVYGGYCALLTSGGVDCWGDGGGDVLGDGASSNSATPVAVEGIGANGTLTGVTSLFSDYSGYCALLTSSEVNCWGSGSDGELGDGLFSSRAVPVTVEVEVTPKGG
jgi:alpha-tubulin suppressor-like RCC1 family protein